MLANSSGHLTRYRISYCVLIPVSRQMSQPQKKCLDSNTALLQVFILQTQIFILPCSSTPSIRQRGLRYKNTRINKTVLLAKAHCVVSWRVRGVVHQERRLWPWQQSFWLRTAVIISPCWCHCWSRGKNSHWLSCNSPRLVNVPRWKNFVSYM